MGLLRKACIHPSEDTDDGYEYIQLESACRPNSTGAIDGSGKLVCCGMCCIRGCLIGSLIALFFLVVLPAGFILIFIGVHKAQAAFIGGGVALIMVPLILCPSSYIIARWTKRKKRDKAAIYAVAASRQHPSQTLITS